MLRPVTILSLFLASLFVVAEVPAQSTDTWFHRWEAAQKEASVAVARLHFREESSFSTDGAFGPREIEVDFDLIVQQDHVSRAVLEIRRDGQVVEEGQGEGRRRFRSPVRRDLLDAADALLFPSELLSCETLETRGPPSPDRVNGREVVRLVTVAPTEEGQIERIVWHFAKRSGRLLKTQAIVRGDDRGTLVVEVYYARHDGLDIPVSRTISGSYGLRRRTRTYTVLLESESNFELIAVETL